MSITMFDLSRPPDHHLCVFYNWYHSPRLELDLVVAYYDGGGDVDLGESDIESLTASVGIERLLGYAGKTIGALLQTQGGSDILRTFKLRDDQKCMKKVEPSSISKAVEDIISIGSFGEALVLNHYVLVRKILDVTPALVKAVGESCVTCGGPHAYYNCPNNDSNQPSVCVAMGTYNQVVPQNCASNFMVPPGFASNQSSTSGTLPSNTIPNPDGEMKAITIRSGVAYEGPSIPTPKKDKLFELAKIPLNENCSAMLLKKLLEKLGDPGKFLIPCDFPRMDTTSYSSTYDDLSVNWIDIIDVAREEYAQEIFGFSNNSLCVNPTSTSERIISDSSPSLTPFEGSDFILEEIKVYLKDESISPEIDHANCDMEGDICLIEKLLNDDPFQLPPMDLKQGEVVKVKSSIKKPPELELKDLPSHLEYAYLEGVDKAIAWKITDIKGIDPRFCTHKNLMEEDYKPAVQSQRRVNLKIHKVIKKEVIKLLNAGMIYPISDSPWVSPIHCVPKKCGITVVENENNELIPIRLVTRWRVGIDYRKLNDATCKDHFPLPFMDQMLERLDGNEFYCFLDGFSGYFQILINLPDQEKTMFICPYGTFAYRRMAFGLCNAPGTFQRCTMVIFHDMIEKTMDVFMDDFLVFEDSFSSCLSHLNTMLQRCEDTNLVLN
uniref:Reverse transcriptase domain-containing protein n=1 Tax=Tanacetum cinerariifolium TaxID=118510 RepID=A0A6L2MYV3_TANCI|nr:reverse transcriptase domain-containing protein [Tanacetum cinerariifolium]